MDLITAVGGEQALEMIVDLAVKETVHLILSSECCLWSRRKYWCNITLAWFTLLTQLDLEQQPRPIAVAPAADFSPAPADGVELVHREWHNAALCQNGVDALKSGCASTTPPNQTVGNRSGFATDCPCDLFVSHPVIGGGAWVLLGELDKFATVSEQRFEVVVSGVDGLTLKLRGAVGEVVQLTVLNRAVSQSGAGPWRVVQSAATVGSDGTVEVTFKAAPRF